MVTGISKETLLKPGVLSEVTARRLATKMLEGKIVVGHAVQNDFEALARSEPRCKLTGEVKRHLTCRCWTCRILTPWSEIRRRSAR